MSVMQAREETIQVSVVIPTRNRREMVREVVESLWSQTLDPSRFEILVIDNCSGDGTAEMMRELAARSPCRLVYERMAENRGQIHTRNVGARMARAPILAFTDSDCRCSPGWLEAGLRAFGDDPRVGFVSGPVRNKPEQKVTFLSVSTFHNEGENIMYPACNIFYRAAAFSEVGGFDESAWPGDIGDKSFGDSDTDLAWKVKNAGYESRFCEAALIYHQVWSLSLPQWLLVQLMAWRIPGVMKRNPEVRRLRWWGPFLFFDNLLFYAATAGVLLAAAGFPWALLLAAPHAWRMLTMPGARFSLARLPRIAARTAVLSLRQAAICAALIYGSIRARTILL